MLPYSKWLLTAVILFALLFYGVMLSVCHGADLTASWYSVESCLREGTSGIMANGEKLNDNDYTAASWDHSFGTIIEVKNLENGKMVRVQVTDRGPSRRLYRQGRVIDLSMAAFQAIADLRRGVVPISIRVISKGG